MVHTTHCPTSTIRQASRHYIQPLSNVYHSLVYFPKNIFIRHFKYHRLGSECCNKGIFTDGKSFANFFITLFHVWELGVS